MTRTLCFKETHDLVQDMKSEGSRTDTCDLPMQGQGACDAHPCQ